MNLDHPISEVKVSNEEVEFKPLGGRVLIVDDEEDLRSILEEFLVGFGIEVEVASNGVAALEKLSENQFDVLLTDVQMPLMGGEELIHQVMKNKDLENMKFLVLTGNVDENIFSKESLLNEMNIDVCSKPFTEESIYQILKKIL